MKGTLSAPRPTRRQLGARLPRSLYDLLKKSAHDSGKSYPAILADAFIHHVHEIANEPGSNGAHPFEYRPPTRVTDGVLVQFYLNTIQIELLKELADRTGNSMAEVIRELLKRHLGPSSQNGVVSQNGAAG